MLNFPQSFAPKHLGFYLEIWHDFPQLRAKTLGILPWNWHKMFNFPKTLEIYRQEFQLIWVKRFKSQANRPKINNCLVPDFDRIWGLYTTPISVFLDINMYTFLKKCTIFNLEILVDVSNFLKKLSKSILATKNVQNFRLRRAEIKSGREKLDFVCLH